MKYLKLILASLVFSFMFVGPALTVAAPVPANAACEDRLLGIPPWYRGVVEGSDCHVVMPTGDDAVRTFVTKIALNFIEIGMVIVGYVALFFIIIGGFKFLTGGDNPGQVEKARNTILNAIIGLAISIGSVAILNVIFGVIQ